jgi:hypothetical protein
VKRLAVIALASALACALAPLASAELYKYVDKDGKTVYSDQPPVNADSKQLHVAPASTSAPKSYVERDKELDKQRKEAAEKEKKSEQSAAQAKAAEERCTQAQANYKSFEEGGRLLKYNDKGEREYMTDDEIEAGRAKSKQQMEEACKKS